MTWRYQRQSLYAERGNVLTYEGIDPLTGLPVLIYSFPGQLDAALRHLESENIPGLLAVASEGELTQVAVAYSREYQPLLSPPQIAVHTLLLDSARALRDAAEAGVLHGDIRPVRFLASPTHLLLEGFGIPWPPEASSYRAPELTGAASYAGDVYAWAKSLLELDLRLSSRQKRVLEACLHENPDERPTASELYTTLEAEPSESVRPELTADTLELTFDTGVMAAGETVGSAASPEFAELGLALEAQAASSAAPLAESAPLDTLHLDAPPRPKAPEPDFDIDGFDDPSPLGVVFTPRSPEVEASEPEPLVIMSDPGRKPAAQRAQAAPSSASEGGFVKTLPPGATYRPGATVHDAPPGRFKEPELKAEVKQSPRQWRNLLRFVAILMVAAAVAVLVFLQRQQTQPTVATPGGASVSNYIVEVIIEPANLPPVGLYVVSAPEGTRTPAGAQVGSYQPGRNQIVLDRPGNWQFQVRFEDRASDVVALQLPEQRSLRFTLAPPAEPEEESTP